MSDLNELSQLGTAPVSAESRAGVSVRYEADFEALQGEIEKMASVTGAAVNWRHVRELASRILREQSKDLLVAAYLGLGLLRTDGYPGLSAGLQVFRDLLEGFWDDLFPPPQKMRGREAAVLWLDEHVTKALADLSASGDDRGVLQALQETTAAISTLVGEKFPGDGPRFSDIPRSLQEKIESIPATPPPGETVAEGERPGESSPAVVIQEVKAVIDSPEKVREAVLESVAFLRGSSPADPRTYGLLRSLLWDEIQSVPAHRDGTLESPGGDADALASWEADLSGGEFRKVLDAVESRLPSDRLWLDLNLLAVRALEGLGPEFAAARRTIADRVGALVRRLPELAALSFDGGVALASSSTRMWIQGEILPAAAGEPDSEDALEVALREARKLVSRRKLADATTLLQRGMQAARPGRERFLWRLELATLCQEAGQAELALPIFESLDEEAREFRMEQWEPTLCVEVVKRLWQCYSAFRKREGFPEKAAQVYGRLCRLDLTAAMALDGKK